MARMVWGTTLIACNVKICRVADFAWQTIELPFVAVISVGGNVSNNYNDLNL
jgi:hypothetical protein